MTRLTVKGRKDTAMSELEKRCIAPIRIWEEKSHFIPDLWSTYVDVISKPENDVRLAEWFGEGDSERAVTGQFREGTLLYFSSME